MKWLSNSFVSYCYSIDIEKKSSLFQFSMNIQHSQILEAEWMTTIWNVCAYQYTHVTFTPKISFTLLAILFNAKLSSSFHHMLVAVNILPELNSLAHFRISSVKDTAHLSDSNVPQNLFLGVIKNSQTLWQVRSVVSSRVTPKMTFVFEHLF